MAVAHGSGSAYRMKSHISKGSKGSSSSNDSMAKKRGMSRKRPKSEG